MMSMMSTRTLDEVERGEGKDHVHSICQPCEELLSLQFCHRLNHMDIVKKGNSSSAVMEEMNFIEQV